MIICNNKILQIYIYLPTIYQVIRNMKSITRTETLQNDFSKDIVDSYEIYKKMQAITYTVGLRIKTARINRGLSRKELGDKLGAYQTLCRVEVGVFEQLDAVCKLADILDINLKDLFAEPFTYSEKPSYGAICRENKILKKIINDAKNKK